jgi:hypothetical protein
MHSLLSDMKIMNAKQICIFKIGVIKLIDEILDNAESDDHPLAWQKCSVVTTSTLNSSEFSGRRAG